MHLFLLNHTLDDVCPQFAFCTWNFYLGIVFCKIRIYANSQFVAEVFGQNDVVLSCKVSKLRHKPLGNIQLKIFAKKSSKIVARPISKQLVRHNVFKGVKLTKFVYAQHFFVGVFVSVLCKIFFHFLSAFGVWQHNFWQRLTQQKLCQQKF